MFKFSPFPTHVNLSIALDAIPALAGFKIEFDCASADGAAISATMSLKHAGNETPLAHLALNFNFVSQ